MAEQTGKQQIGRWGKWGAADERGALNFITPAVTARAASLVREGRSYQLGLPIQRRGIPVTGPHLRNPPLHLMSVDGGDFAAGAKGHGGVGLADDYIMVATHGGTHVDALCHVWIEDQIYNGFSSNTIRSSGARYCGADKIGPVVTRGVLADIAGLKGKTALDPGYAITPADLHEALSATGVGELRSGDVLLVRTGWLSVYKEDPEKFEGARPGIGQGVARGVIDSEVTMVGVDTQGAEVSPSEDGRVVPVHIELLRHNGVYLMEMLQLDELARDKVYEFLFVLAPLPITGGTASPINPIAVV